MEHYCLRCDRTITEAEVKYQDGYCADCYMIVMGDVDEDGEDDDEDA